MALVGLESRLVDPAHTVVLVQDVGQPLHREDFGGLQGLLVLQFIEQGRGSGNIQMLQQRGSVGDQGRGSDDFASLRPYHAGDSLRHVHWKALAREQGLVTKQFGGGVSEQPAWCLTTIRYCLQALSARPFSV